MRVRVSLQLQYEFMRECCNPMSSTHLGIKQNSVASFIFFELVKDYSPVTLHDCSRITYIMWKNQGYLV